MKTLPWKARVYILTLATLTLFLAAGSIYSLDWTSERLLQVGVFILAVFVADLFPIVLPYENNAEITISSAFSTAAAIMFGPRATVLIVLLGTLLSELTLRRAWYKALFNIAEIALTFAGISLIYYLLYDGVPNPFHSAQNALALATMIVAYFLLNVGLVAAVVSLTTHASFWHIWKTNFRDLTWNNLTIIPLGAIIATLWLNSPWSILALVLPIVVVRQSFQYIGELQRQTRQALISMADTIDQRDPSTYQHSQRVAILSAAIAEEMGLPAEEVETIRMAARLHDVGKIGMSNALLYKPGKFDEREQAEFRRHPQIGAELVKSFRLFSEGQILILHHHERYDGQGYPAGLAGEAIPLGSRILAVADSLDAMTSVRPYRPSVSLAEAVQEIERNSGTQFDPEVVRVFLRILARWGGTLPWAQVGSTPITLPSRPMEAASLKVQA